MNVYLAIFLILAIGYAIGRLEIKGLGFGSAAVLLVALVFGHFGVEIPGVVKNVGLVLFVSSVGIITGPVFFDNFKNKALSFVTLGIVTVLIGAIVCVLCIKLMDIPVPLSLGLMTGALTSTPGLAAALEATNDSMASIGYGIAYVYGVVGVVLFVQLIPRLTKASTDSLKKAEAEAAAKAAAKPEKHYIEVGAPGFFALAFVAVTGVLLGKIAVPLPGGLSFSLGMSGGPLFTGLLVGSLGHVGPISLQAPKKMMETIREFGMVLFFTAAGTEAGAGFVEILTQHGFKLLFAGFLMTTIPMVLVYLMSRKIFRIETFTALGSVCGGMTSTPALGALLNVAKSDIVAVAYAATYPVALIMVVISAQIINMFF